MKQIVTTLGFIAVAYAAPLIAAPALLLDWRIVTLMVAGVVMLMTQPAFTLKDASVHKNNDRLSVFLILGAGVVCQILPVLEWAYGRNLSEATPKLVAIVIGLSMLIGGLAFRIWSIRTLGKFFTATVQRVEGQRVIKHGPYTIVRHPSYLGAYVAMLGSAVLLEAYFSVVIGAIAIWLVYQYRIRFEEQLLTREFGEEYRQFMANTPALIPAVCGRRVAETWKRCIAKLERIDVMMD